MGERVSPHADGTDGRVSAAAREWIAVRLMLGIWTFVLVTGLVYFTVIGLTHQ